MHRCLLLCCTLIACVAPAGAQERKKFPLPEGVKLLADVEFGKGGGRPLKMHLLLPEKKGQGKLPAIVWVHGGGWRNGNNQGGLRRLPELVRRGFVGASIEYRLSGEAPFPAQIEDCKCAIRFLRAHADQFGIDPERIGVWGSSAGGHLVALLGTSGHVAELEGKGGWEKFSSKVQAVCDFCGPTDLMLFRNDNPRGTIGLLLGGQPSTKKDLARSANPLTHLTREAPPFLIVHGDQDKTVPLEHSRLLADALKKAGVPVTLLVAEGQGHGLGGPEVMRAVTEFFEKTLRK